jgi:hypothetical protein
MQLSNPKSQIEKCGMRKAKGRLTGQIYLFKMTIHAALAAVMSARAETAGPLP